MSGVVTAAVATHAATARLTAQGAGAWPRRAAVAAALATKTAPTATAPPVEGARDASAATAARGGVGRYADVVQGQDPGVENPAGHGPGRAIATVATRSRDQAPGNHQPVEGHDTARGYFDHPGPVLTIQDHIRRAIVVQVTVDGDVLVDQQLGGELHGHAGVEGDDVAVLRRGNRGAQ
ncbi:hypothetical protein D3C85_1263470 [compost metagenome]